MVNNLEIYVPLAGVINLKEEKARLQNEINSAQDDLNIVKKKLDNKGFINKAPADVVEKQKEKKANLEEKINRFKQRIQYI